MNRIYFIPPGTNFEPERPTADDLNNGVDITDYVTDGDLRFRADLRRAAEQMATAMGVGTGPAAASLRDLAKALDAHVYEKPRPPQRHINTHMKYPTSTPPWASRRK